MAHILSEYLIYDLIHLIEIDVTRKAGKHYFKEKPKTQEQPIGVTPWTLEPIYQNLH